MRVWEKLYIFGVLVAGVLIGVMTIAMPDRSPGPIGLVYALVYILSTSAFLWATYGPFTRRE